MGKHISVVIFYLSPFIPSLAEEESLSRTQGDSSQDPVYRDGLSIICWGVFGFSFCFIVPIHIILALLSTLHHTGLASSRGMYEQREVDKRAVRHISFVGCGLWFLLHSYGRHEKNPLRKLYLDLSFPFPRSV